MTKISQEHSSTRIGQSSFNSGWIEGAYGAQEKAKMKDKRILCSGSTIGEQVAIEVGRLPTQFISGSSIIFPIHVIYIQPFCPSSPPELPSGHDSTI